jgi:LPXTG-site transpeptidase (sortase) family protein
LQIATYLDSDAPDGSLGFYLDSEIKPIEEYTENTYTRPDRVVIPKIGVNTVVNKPNSRTINALDSALNTGAVHYPGSGSIESGNMFIFGHSTGFQVVQNQAYKAFNDLDKLNRGDEISVYANGVEYVYIVRTVSLVDENSAEVRFDQGGRTLTISTCNSFGAKQDRFVVEADFYTKG